VRLLRIVGSLSLALLVLGCLQRKEPPITSGLCEYLREYRAEYRPDTQDVETQAETARQEVYFNRYCKGGDSSGKR
jgi:hypothetical protein